MEFSSRLMLVVASAALLLTACDKKPEQPAATDATTTANATGTANPTDEGTATVVTDWILQPGKWEISGKVMSQGMQTEMPVTSICLKAPVNLDSQLGAPNTQAGDCKISNNGVHGGKLRLTVSCDKPAKNQSEISAAMISNTEFNVVTDSTTSVNGMDIQSSIELKYKHVGACEA